MPRRARSVLPCVALLALAACAGSDVRVSWDRDESFAFPAYRTWSWLERPVPESIDPRLYAPELDARVRREVERALAARGYERVDAGGDFGVRYHVAVEEMVDVQTINEYYGYGAGLGASPSGGTTTYTRTWEQGTLILDVVDRDAARLVWRGSAQAEIHPGADSAHRDERVRRAVEGILSGFPKR